MPKFKVSMSEPERFFPTFGHLHDGDVVTVDEQPSDGVTWSWSEADKAAEPVVPAQPPVVPDQPAS